MTAQVESWSKRWDLLSLMTRPRVAPSRALRRWTPGQDNTHLFTSLTASAGTQSRVLWFHLQDSPHNYFFLLFSFKCGEWRWDRTHTPGSTEDSLPRIQHSFSFHRIRNYFLVKEMSCGRLNASWKISSSAVDGQSFLVIDGSLLN